MRRIAVVFSVLVAGCLAASATPAIAAGPTAIGVDSAGVVYVGFANGGQIKRYNGTDGSALSPFGTPGSAAGQIGGVVAIDVAPGATGNVWILDTNRRVQEFTRAGQFIRGIQLNPCEGGITPDPLTRGGLDVSNDSVYVAHPCANSVLRLRANDLQVQATASPTAVKGISAQLYSSAPSNTNALYAAQPSLNQVSILQPQYFSQLGTKSTPAPADVFVDAFGVLFASDLANDKIHLYGSDGNEFRTLGSPGSAAGQLNDPVAFDVFEQFSDLAGNLFIADYGNNRIQRWNSFGFTYWTAPADDTGGGGPGPAPVNTAAPQIQGTPTQGQSVTCTQGSWTNNPTSYSYQWSRNGSPIGGATNSTYTIVAADVGQSLTCTVTATNAGGSASASSAGVVPVAGVQVPVNMAPPQISGTPTPGNTLSCSQGTWSNSPTGYAYQWRRDGSAIAGATGTTYTVVAADVSHALTCAVTASNSAGSSTAVSSPVTVTSGACATGTVGVSINNGAPFTNSPGVTLTIHEPAGATNVTISNDGGFGALVTTTSAIACTDTYAWSLGATDPSRQSKAVYVRFTGPGIDALQTFSDDIMLDQNAPAMARASLREASLSPAAAKSSTAKRYVLSVNASDKGTGVAKIQTATSRNAARQTTYRYSSKLRLRYLGSARYVRAIDRAGNVGAWKKVALSRALSR